MLYLFTVHNLFFYFMKKLNSMFRRTEKGVGVNVFNNFRFCPVICGFFLFATVSIFQIESKSVFRGIHCAYDATVADLGVYIAFR